MAAISLFVMARDAARTIEACLDSAAPYVDEIVVAFGGPSSDGTEELVRSWGARSRGTAFPLKTVDLDWQDDFARARNAGWKHLTGEYALWLDADDILVNGHLLEGYIADNPDANLLISPYHYDQDEYGNLACTLWRERVVRDPKKWYWEGAIHETLNLKSGVALIAAQATDLIVRHQEGRVKSKGTRNLDILYRELAKTEPNPSQRLLFYLGRENASRGNWHEALLHWNRYISQAQVDDEAFQVAFYIADTMRAQGLTAEAAKATMRAIQIKPAWPDGYFLLARIAYEQGRFEETVEWTKAGATKVPPQTSAIIDPRAYSYWPYYYLGLAYRGLGANEQALANLQIAARVIPDAQIEELLAQTREALSGQQVLSAFQTLYEHLGRNDEWLKVRRLFAVAPKAIELHPEVRAAHLRVRDQTAHLDDPALMEKLYREGEGWVPMADDAILSPDWARHPRMAFARKSISCDPPATILDLGCADGFISLPLAKDGHIVTGYDLNAAAIKIAQRRAKEWHLRAKYAIGGLDALNANDKYDVALAMEVIEHLPDPVGFLDGLDTHARKVVLSTPFLAWDRGQRTDWNTPTLKEHLRTYDLLDMEALLSGRGRIFDLYHEPVRGHSGWIFAAYRPRQEYSGSVTFLAPETIEEWSPRKLRTEGLGGSETALIRLAEELFLGGELLCSVFGRIDHPGYYNGVRYRGLDAFAPDVATDVCIAWRYPEAADLPLRAKRLILWLHDMDYRERLTPVRAARFDRIVVLSEWHRQHILEVYPFIDPEKLVVIGNGVELERFAPRTPKGGSKDREVQIRREPHRVIYTSSPDRGLDAILEHVWPKVVTRVPDAELHVYYGWRNFEILGQRSEWHRQFRERVAQLVISTKNVVQHGRLPQDELARELQRASVWLYPSHNFDETYCISAIEAQLAGVIPVVGQRGALVETARSGVAIKGTIGTDGGVTEQYVEAVVGLLTASPRTVGSMRRQARRAAPAHAWSEIAHRWLEVLSA